MQAPSSNLTSPPGALLRLLPLVLLLVLALTGVARGEWLQARSQGSRTARVDGVSSITEPQLKWRYHLGGSLSATQFIPTPSGGAQGRGFIMVGADGLKGVRLDGARWWGSGDYFPSSIVGYFDFNNTGHSWLVTVGTFKESGYGGVFIHHPVDGTLLWNTPGDHFTVGQIQVRVADLTGDGRLELLVSAASLAPGSTALPVRAYSLSDLGSGAGGDRNGGNSLGRLLWTIDQDPRDYYGSFHDLLVDWDGDGNLELVTQGRDYLYIYDARTGALVKTLDGGGKFSASRSLVLQSATGRGGSKELFFFSPGGFTSRNSSVRVAMFTAQEGAGGGLDRVAMVWQRTAQNHDTARLAADHTSVGDVRGTGQARDVVYSIGEDNQSPWELEVRDGLTGQLLASLPDHRFESVWDLDGDGRGEILAYGSDQALRVFSYLPREPGDLSSGEEPGRLVQRWDLGERVVLKCPMHGETMKGSTRLIPCALPGTGEETGGGEPAGNSDPHQGAGLVLGVPHRSGRILALEKVGYHPGEPGQLTVLSTFHPKDGEEIISLNMAPGDPSVLGVVVSPGHLVLLDHRLNPLNYRPNAEPPVMGVRIESLDPGYGGHIMSLAAADLDGEPGDELVVVTGNHQASVLDVSQATFAGDARDLLRIPQAQVAGVARGPGGARGVVVAEASAISVYGLEHGLVWSREVYSPDDRLVRQGSLLMADLDGDGVDEIVYQGVDLASNSYFMGALNLADGSHLWGPATMDTNSYGWRRLTALSTGPPPGGDASGKGRALLAGGRVNGWWLFDAMDGQPTYQSPVATVGAYGVAVDVDGDGSDEYLAVNWTDLALYGTDGALLTKLESPGSTRYGLGAVVECPPVQGGGGPGASSRDLSPIYVSPISNSCGLFAVDLAQGAIIWEKFLSGGQVVDSPGELARLGLPCMALGNVAAIREHRGSGGEGGAGGGNGPMPGAVVGGADRYVYAVEGCSGDKLWSIPVEAPVREVIFADWTGDGNQEVVALSTDGYITGIGEAAMESPGWVMDVDPSVSLTEDADEIETVDTLYGAWAPVQGATGYLAAVYTLDGLMVTQGYLQMGRATFGTVRGLPLVEGVRYVMGVKAVGEKGESPPRLSDGVTVRVVDQGASDSASDGGWWDGDPEDALVGDGPAGSGGGGSLEPIDQEYSAHSGCGCSILPGGTPPRWGYYGVILALVFLFGKWGVSKGDDPL